jgi:UDP-N-acetylmuramoyl-L-alanyl-D-glutamate--2,6-diaminopimelate ligase
MGKVAEKYCDEIIITNDNPRNEDPSSIASQILKGCSGAEIILDRVEAIKSGLSKINDNEVLLIAGKGHEEFQIIGDDKIPFSDRKVVENFFEASHE